MKEQAVTRKD